MTREEAINFLRGYLDEEAYTEKCRNAHEMAIELLERTRWIPISERLPEKHGDYLVTLENGDVFNCYFNPDYCYDGHDNGAFTYTQEYFDNKTIGSLGSEEIVFDGVVAWMPYEPYKGESEE